MGLIVERSGALATVTLNNPPLNILTEATRQELFKTFNGIKQDQSIRVVVLQGQGNRAFSVGSDLGEFHLENGVDGGKAKVEFEQRLHDLIESLPQVTIAMLRGFILGGGCELMMPCDLRISTLDSVFGFPEIKVGGFPCSGGTQRLLHLVGPSKAKELLLFGENISAQEAYQLGLVTKVVPSEQLSETVESVVNKLLLLPWLDLQAIKRCVNTGMWDPVRGPEVEVEEYCKVFNSEDMREGIQAFFEKRPPQYRHR